MTILSPNDSGSNRKLKEIQELAARTDSDLNGEFGRILKASGGVLFLGKNYATTSRLLLGLNPGSMSDPESGSDGSQEEDSFCVKLFPQNPWETLRESYAYWRNCCFFVNAVRPLRVWFESATVAFCLPWRTPSYVELRKLDRQMNGKLSACSGMLFRKMLEHHRMDCDSNGPVLILAGKASLAWIASPSFLNFDWPQYTVGKAHGESSYQWRKLVFRDITMYQVPHFSRANSHKRLEECARWLASELGLAIFD